jgi:signal peptidase II
LEARSTGRASVRAIVLLVVIALGVLIVDQLAKWWVVTNLPYRVPREVVGNLLIFEYDRNPGAAFSIGTGSTWIFSIVGVAVLIFVIWYARRIRSMVWALVFGLVLGGLMGNLSDRLFRPPGFGVGEVVDFLRIPLLPAIFNLADSAIVSAMVLFLLLTVLGVGLDGRRPSKAVVSGDATAGAAAEGGETSSGRRAGGDDLGAHGDAVPRVGGDRIEYDHSEHDHSEPDHDGTAAHDADADSTDADGTDANGTDERAQSRAARVGGAEHPVDGRA